MSDGRNTPISIIHLPQEPISWVIDRIGDRSIIDNWNSTINIINDTNSFNNFIEMDATYPTNNNFINNQIIDWPPSISFTRSKPSELVLDEAIQFSEEQCECCICMDQKEEENICQLNCGHSFCVSCIDTSLKTFRDRNQDVICALCRGEVKKITFKKQENKDKIQEYL